jgi:hypothetical protein
MHSVVQSIRALFSSGKQVVVCGGGGGGVCVCGGGGGGGYPRKHVFDGVAVV